jgi:crossover junction endodeoxyribonuclease RusA
MRLVLPFPPRELSPNARLSWRVKARYTKKYRHDCGWLGKTVKKPPHFKLIATFHEPDNHHRDEDNYYSAFKAGRDGLADAWGVDDNIFTIDYRWGAPVKGGAVIITLAEVV